MKQLIVVVDTVRYVTEEWVIALNDDQDPDVVGNKLKEDPSSLYWDYSAHLVHSEDVDDEIREIIEWRTNEDDNRTT